MSVVLPTPENETGSNEWSDVYANDRALKEAIEALQAEVATLSAVTHPVAWSAAKVISTEETRASTSFGTLSTADEITGIVVPENGFLQINYSALVKVSFGGSVAIFIGSNQLKSASNPVAISLAVTNTGFGHVYTEGDSSSGLQLSESVTSLPTTGYTTESTGVVLPGGTYSISVRYKASSGSITAKERKLWAYVLGV